MYVCEVQFLRDHWYPVARVDELVAPRAVMLFGQEYVVWPVGDGAVACADPYCPHRSAHLGTGWVDGGDIVCPYHGWRFDAAGSCSHIPQIDDHVPVPPRARLRTYPAQSRYGLVWICVGDRPPVDGPPRWKEAEDHPEWRFHVEFFEEWNAAAPRIVDNNLDLSHVAYVHAGTFGDPDDAAVPPYDVEPNGSGGFRIRAVTEHRGVGAQNGLTSDEQTRLRRVTEIELLAPLVTRTRLEYEGAAPDYCFYSAITPVDDDRSIYVRLTALSGSDLEQPWDTFHAFGTRVKEEDRRVLESTVADYPVEATGEVHLRCDRATLEYRRYLKRHVDDVPVGVRSRASVGG